MIRQDFLYPELTGLPLYREVELAEMLRERDEREELRLRWQQDKMPYLSLCLNLPGPRKRGALSDYFFCGAERALLAALTDAGAVIRRWERRNSDAGLSSHLQPQEISAADAKKIALSLEEAFPAARLLDIDVFDGEGRKLSGESDRGLRRCLICEKEAYFCARSRAHGTEEILSKASVLIRSQLLDFYAEELRLKALKAMLREVSASPKPGLVDRENNGSHQDMDFYLFTDSSVRLFELLERITARSLRCLREGDGLNDEAVAGLCECGRMAEQTLLRKNGGVNTQNGLFFAFSILIPSALHLFAQSMHLAWTKNESLRLPTAEEIGKRSAALAGKVCKRYLEEHPGGADGARASALAGYRLLTEEAVPLLKRLREQSLPRDACSLRVLLYLMARAEDSNLLRRGGEEALKWVQGRALQLEREFGDLSEADEAAFLAAMRSFDEEMRRRNLSPGGAADLLALSWFLAEADRESAL